MERLLKTQPWQVFILLVIGVFISNCSVENDSMSTTILKILGSTIYFIYPLTVGCFLNSYIPKKIKLNYNLYLVNSFICYIAYSAILIFSNGAGMIFNGLAAIPMLYLFYASIHFLAFPAKTLKSIELNKEAGLGEYLGDFFLILFLPIGIWFLQPRVRQIVERDEIIYQI